MSMIGFTLLLLISAFPSDPERLRIESDSLGSLEATIERIEPDEEGSSERFQLRRNDEVLVEIRCHRVHMGTGEHEWHPDLPLAERLLADAEFNKAMLREVALGHL